MPSVKYAPAAIRDLQRLREFLRSKSPAAAQRAGEAILKAAKILGRHPFIGRPVDDLPDPYRELVINFGDSGYLARYRVDGDSVIVLAIRHQKEVGFAMAP